MLLIKYKVNKFRSIKGTEWIDIDQWACFDGVNESGKTNLLLPLWKFNPADKATNIDLLHDYPRDEYSELDDEKNSRKEECFIDILFELSDEEIEQFEQYYSEGSIEDEKILETEEKTESPTSKGTEKFGFTKHLLISKDYKERFYLYFSNEKAEKKSEDIEEKVGKAAFQKICKAIPRFVYYSEYGNLDSDLYLPHVKDNLQRIDELTGKERMKARTLKILFSYLKLDPDQIMELGQEISPDNNPKQKNAGWPRRPEWLEFRRWTRRRRR